MIRKFLWLSLFVSPLAFGFTLTWDEPTTSSGDLATIQIFQSTISGTYGTPLATVPAQSPNGGGSGSYVGIDPNKGTFFWVVKACDTSNNCSSPSNEATKTFFDTTAPGSPTNLQVTP